MKKLGFLALVFALIFVSSAQAKSSNHMSLTTTAGKVINIDITPNGFEFKQYPGKTVLMNFFGPMCPPCIIEMPHLIELQKEHKDEIQIIAVQVQMPMEQGEIKDFVKKNNINYPVINLNDAWDIVSFVKANTNWGGQIPFMMMFDKKGYLKQQYMGLVENDKLLRDMKK
jgi:thiol-disulfide isomerase/thioredoxin